MDDNQMCGASSNSKEEVITTITVKNIPSNFNAEDVKRRFIVFGDIRLAIKTKDDGIYKIRYHNESDALCVIESSSGMTMDNKKLAIKMAPQNIYDSKKQD